MTVGINERYPAYKAKGDFRNKMRREQERLMVVDRFEQTKISRQKRALQEAVKDVRDRHRPSQWDICIMDNEPWPCCAELLAELIMT